jgi:hypothetical protein
MMVNRIRFGQSVRSRLVLPLLALPLCAAAAGCAAGGGMSLIVTTPNTNQILDAGQSLPVSATVINDAQAFGATFAATAGSFGLETISRVGSVSIVGTTYNAPASVTTQTTVTVTATSQNTPSQTASFTITVYPALVISTATLPNGSVGTAYSSTVATAGGSGSLAFSVGSGALPNGLSLNASTGAITGTPTAFGTFTFTVSVLDASAAKVPTTQSYTVAIAPQQPVITTSTLPNGLAGTAYSQQLSYTGGNGTTPSFTATGALPAGLTLSSSGLIAGTPTVASSGTTYNFSVTVAIGTQTSAPKQLSITIPAYPTVTTTSLPNGNIGIAYSKQLNYNGGAGGTVIWAISPTTALNNSGLTFNTATGVISGTPTTATTYSFTVTVTVGTQTSAPQALTLTVYALDITSATSATGELNLPFSFHLAAAGGTAPYTWQVLGTGNALPAGLTLNATTGLISGTPTSQGTVTGVNIQATDSAAPANTATVSMSFTINAARASTSNSELTGSYAFLVSGFDATGYPLAAIGQFTAAAGVITSGSIDVNGTNAADKLSNQALAASTYSVGPDNRGKLTLTYGGTTYTFVIVVNGLVSNVATSGYLTEFDNTGRSLTGVFAAQNLAAFSSPSFGGTYAFGMQGAGINATPSALTHRSEAGVVGLGTSTSVPEYVQSSSTSGSPLTATSTGSVLTSAGRYTLSYGQPSGASGASQANFVLYPVNGTKLFIMSSDNAYGTVSATGVNDLLYGQMLQQTSSTFTAASLNGTSVVRTESLPTTAAGATYVDARLGLYTFNGTTVQFSADENAGGAPKTLAQTSTFTVNSNGRVTVNFPNGGLSGCANCVGSGNTYFYLVGPNQGFVVDLTTAATAGYFEPQTATSLSAGSFSGSYAIGSTLPLAQAATYLTAEALASGTGTVSGTADQNANGTLSADVSFSGTYVVAPSGRATFTALGSGTSVLYVVSGSKAYLLDTATTTPVIEDVIQ